MKKNLITGMVILLPVIITLVVIVFIVNLLTQPFIGAVSQFFSHFEFMSRGFLFLSPEQVIKVCSQLLILIFLFLFIWCLGAIARSFFMKSFLHLGDKLLHSIPLVKTVYKTTQDIVKTVFASDATSFKQVVLVPFPTPNIYVLGLITRDAPSTCSKMAGEDLVSILIPTTPNPTTGFLLMYPRKELIFVDMKTEDAIKFIVSCGVILPEDRSQLPLVPPI